MINKLANGKFIPVIEAPSADWQGRSGMVHKAVMDDVNNLVDYDIYLAGRFEMVAVVRGDFVEQGALIEHMYADAFAFI